MLRKWIEHLRDPESGQKLELQADGEGEEVVSGSLSSAGGASHPIVGGIPRFVPSSLYSSDGNAVASATVQCYGKFWEQAEGIQSSAPSAAEMKGYTEVLCGMLGVSGPEELGTLFRDGANVLNAGCGIAWAEYLFNVNERANRFGIDLSSSVEIAFARTRHLPNVCIVQGDLLRMPFPENHFDVIFCGGVLHHIPRPAEAFASLCRHLAPGGKLGIFIYKVKPFLRELADREIKKFTTKMSAEDCREFSRQMAMLGRALQQIEQKLVIDEDIPLLGIKRGTYGVQRFLYDHFLKCYFNPQLDFEQSVLANIDWYSPSHASHHTEEEIRSWFADNGLEQVKFVDLPGWEHASFFVSGRKPR